MKMKTKELKENLPYMFLVIGIVGVFYATSLFFIGFHNTDLAINFLLFEERSGIEIIDNTSVFTQVSGEYLYIVGTEQMRVGFILLGLSFFIIGSCLTKIRGKKK